MKNRILFEQLITNGALTTEDIEKIKSIEGPMELDLIELSNGRFLPRRPDELYSYGLDLLNKREYKCAVKCFEICTKIDPNHYPSIIQLAINAVYHENYAAALSYLEPLKKSHSAKYVHDYNFYLLLISHLYDLDEKSKEYVANLTFEDIWIYDDDSRYANSLRQNDLRNKILQQQFYHAVSIIKEITAQQTTNIEFKLTEKLLRQITASKKAKTTSISQAIAEKDYQKMIAILEAKERRHPLKIIEYKQLCLARDLYAMSTSRVPIKPIAGPSKDGFEVTRNHQYERMYVTNLIFTHKKGIPPEKDSLGTLIHDAIVLRDELIAHQKNKCTKIHNIDYLKEIYASLLNGEYDVAYTLIYAYLTSKDKDAYYYLIRASIEKSILLHSKFFSHSMHMLGYIVDDALKIDFDNYLKELSFYLKIERLDCAEILLRVIHDMIDHGHITIDDSIQDTLADFTDRVCELKRKQTESSQTFIISLNSKPEDEN